MRIPAARWFVRVANVERIKTHRLRLAVLEVSHRDNAVVPARRISAGSHRSFGGTWRWRVSSGIGKHAERTFLQRLDVALDEEHTHAIQNGLALVDLDAAQRVRTAAEDDVGTGINAVVK